MTKKIPACLTPLPSDCQKLVATGSFPSWALVSPNNQSGRSPSGSEIPSQFQERACRSGSSIFVCKSGVAKKEIKKKEPEPAVQPPPVIPPAPPPVTPPQSDTPPSPPPPPEERVRKSMDQPSIKRLWNGAEALREGFAQKGYVTQEEVKKAIPHAPELYRLYLTTALNDDGIVNRDEYVGLDGISNYYHPLLEDLRQQSPLFRWFKFFAERLKEKKSSAYQFLISSWRGGKFPSLGEQKAFFELLLPLVKQYPEVITLFGRELDVEKSMGKEWIQKLEKEALPLIFHKDEDVRYYASRLVDKQKGLEEIRRRLNQNPEDPYALLALIFFGRDVGGRLVDPKEIKELILKYEARVGRNPADAKAYWALGHLYVASLGAIDWGEWEKKDKPRIAQFFDKATSLEPNNPRFQFDKAAWRDVYDIDSCEYSILEPLEKAVKLDPQNLSYQNRLRCVHLSTVSPRTASLLPKPAEVGFPLFNSYFDLCHLLSRDDDFPDALALCKEGVNLWPAQPQLLWGAGTAYLGEENFDKAGEYLLRGIFFGGGDYLVINKIFSKKGYDLAIKVLEALCKKSPEDEALFHELGKIYHETENYPKAAEAFQKAIELNPNYGHYHGLLGEVYYQSGEREKAIPHLKKGVELGNSWDITYYYLGNTLYELGRYQEAIPYLQQSIRLDPKDVDPYWTLGHCYYYLKQYSKAAQIYLQIARISTDREVKRRALSEAAEAKLKMKDYNGAYELYVQALALSQGEEIISARLAMFRINREVGAIAYALEKGEALFKDYPDNVEVCLEYALVLEKTNSRENWIRARVVLEEKAIGNKLKATNSLWIEVYETLTRILRKLGGEQNIQKADEYTAQAERLKLEINK